MPHGVSLFSLYGSNIIYFSLIFHFCVVIFALLKRILSLKASPIFSVTGNRNSLPATNQLKPISGAPLVPEVRSVSMRDIGTEMTPIASQEPSRTATPLRVNTPTGNSTSSRTPSPSGNPATLAGAVLEESQVKTRREIMKLSEQLGKTNIAAWASREAREDNRTPDQLSKIDSETRAVDWEEAEKSKNLARYRNLILFLMDLHFNIFVHCFIELEIEQM